MLFYHYSVAEFLPISSSSEPCSRIESGAQSHEASYLSAWVKNGFLIVALKCDSWITP